jgi:hypothetical protein
MLKRTLLCLLMFFVLHTVGLAQEGEPDRVGSEDITYGEVVDETITTESFFDHWNFYGSEGDVILIRMAASNGLAPLIGLIDAGGDLIMRSDARSDGSLTDAPVDGVAEIRFTLPSQGEYTIIATRVDNANGTTTGSYRLSLNVEQPTPTKDLQDVTFRCDEFEITTAATFEFNQEGDDGDYYRVTVYGLDGFEPYIRVDIPFEQGVSDCTSDGSKTVNDQYTLPEVTPVTVTEDSPFNAQHILEGMQEMGKLTLVIGSRNGAAGRYVAVIEGFSINEPGDVDNFIARLGPLAAEGEMLVYMMRDTNTRIDPQVQMVAQNPAIDFTCDDAGRFDCADIPAATEYEFMMNDGVEIKGNRLDSGVNIATGNPDRVALQFRSRNGATQGKYTLVIVGELPRQE